MAEYAFVFVHSYSSEAPNWSEVVFGIGEREGRLCTARRLSHEFGLSIVANDALDAGNRACYAAHGIENIGTARNTYDEVVSALVRSGAGRVLFVSSPDHLPRVVRDALAAGGVASLFAASEVAFSQAGPADVTIGEPPHAKEQRENHDA